jgi:hypothetical protein
VDQTAAYQALANALMAVCPPDFTQARVTAEIKDDWSKVEYSCETPSGPKTGLAADADTDFTVDDALHDLRDMMKPAAGAPWSRCTFTLTPDGKFDFAVDYDD